MDVKKMVGDASGKMDEAIGRFQEELKAINTGRANSMLVEGLVVSYYGAPTPLKQIASISTPDAHQIAITPWDRNALSDIESAVRTSDLGLAPTNDGKSVRLNLPPMTEERRRDLGKMVSRISEEAKVSIRNIRGEVWDLVQAAQKRSEITEDDRYQIEKDLNELISRKNEVIEKLTRDKQDEIMKV